jgi:hypothetical protein
MAGVELRVNPGSHIAPPAELEEDLLAHGPLRPKEAGLLPAIVEDREKKPRFVPVVHESKEATLSAPARSGQRVDPRASRPIDCSIVSGFSGALLDKLGPSLVYGYLRLLRRTMRIEYRGREVLEACRRESGAFILVFWHSRFLLMPYAYPGGRMAVLSSRHRDAVRLGRVLGRFGYELSKGSSSRGAEAGLLDLVRKGRSGFDLGITPDGPRGPRRRAKPGAIAAAALTGLPIVPVAFSAAPARRLRTWDRTLLPRLFSRGLFLYGQPIRVGRKPSETERERLRSLLEAELDRITDRADVETGIGPEARDLP